jgi:hypothetical protein
MQAILAGHDWRLRGVLAKGVRDSGRWPEHGAADVFEHRKGMIDGATVIDAGKALAVPASGGTLTPTVIEAKDGLR